MFRDPRAEKGSAGKILCACGHLMIPNSSFHAAIAENGKQYIKGKCQQCNCKNPSARRLDARSENFIDEILRLPKSHLSDPKRSHDVIYEKGREAGFRGKPRRPPYQSEGASSARKRWLDGYDAGKAERETREASSHGSTDGSIFLYKVFTIFC